MRRAVPWLLVLNLGMLVATSETVPTAAGVRCEAVALHPQAFETDEDGRLVLAVVATDGTRLRAVSGEVDAPGCAVTADRGAVRVAAGEGGDEPAPLAIDRVLDDVPEVELVLTSCPKVAIETALEVEACGEGPLGVVLERR